MAKDAQREFCANPACPFHKVAVPPDRPFLVYARYHPILFADTDDMDFTDLVPDDNTAHVYRHRMMSASGKTVDFCSYCAGAVAVALDLALEGDPGHRPEKTRPWVESPAQNHRRMKDWLIEELDKMNEKLKHFVVRLKMGCACDKDTEEIDRVLKGKKK